MVFEKNRSCNTQLLEVILDFQRFADLAIPFDCIYIDFSKAFDKVSIPTLLKKCAAYKLGKKTIVFIADYLNGQTQQVVVGEAISSLIDVLSGVPQGSCLGPILFCLFIISNLKKITVRRNIYFPIEFIIESVLIYKGIFNLKYI